MRVGLVGDKDLNTDDDRFGTTVFIPDPEPVTTDVRPLSPPFPATSALIFTFVFPLDAATGVDDEPIR